MSLIHSSSVPANGRSVVAQHLSDVARSAAPAALKGRSANNLGVTEGYPVYSVDLDNLEESKLLAGAKLRGYRYLVLEGGHAVAEAELIEEPGKGPRVVALHGAPHARGTAKGISAAEGLGRVKSNDHEIAVIEAPGVHFSALWLRRKGADVFVPIDPDLTSLVQGHEYTEAQVLAVLSVLAKHVKAEEAAKPGDSGG